MSADLIILPRPGLRGPRGADGVDERGLIRAPLEFPLAVPCSSWARRVRRDRVGDPPDPRRFRVVDADGQVGEARTMSPPVVAMTYTFTLSRRVARAVGAVGGEPVARDQGVGHDQVPVPGPLRRARRAGARCVRQAGAQCRRRGASGCGRDTANPARHTRVFTHARRGTACWSRRGAGSLDASANEGLKGLCGLDTYRNGLNAYCVLHITE